MYLEKIKSFYKENLVSLKKIVRLALENQKLRLRWMARARISQDLIDVGLRGIERCEVVYINLDHRSDRRAEIESQFSSLGLKKFVRFSAVKRDVGALGCAESHLGVIESWTSGSQSLLMVCEDDCEFLLSRKDIDDLIEEFLSEKCLGVLCLAFNSKNAIRISNQLKITSHTLTTACYLIKPSARDALLTAARRSVESFKIEKNHLPIDVAWLREQKNIFFSIPVIRAAQQRSSFSDIKNEDVEYNM